MKRIFILFTFILLSLTIFSNNIILDNFEDGSINDWHSWNSSPVSVVDNPHTSGNTSSKVALFDQKDGAWDGFAKWFNVPILKENTQKITVDVYFKNTEGILKIQLDNAISETENYEATQEIEANTWTHVEFNFTPGEKLDYQQIAFQSSVADTIYIDNITIIEGNPTDQSIGDFEDNTLQSWGTWGAPLKVADNPLSETNNSSYVALFDQTSGGWSGMALWSDPPIVSEAYESISLDVYFPNSSGIIKLQMDNSKSGAANAELYSDSLSSGQWNNITFDITDYSSLDYNQIAIQSPVADTIYFDNLTLNTSTEQDTDTIHPPKNLTIQNISDFNVNLNWALNNDEDSVLLAISENEIIATPSNETSYKNGDQLPDGSVIIYKGDSTSYKSTNLNTNTQYYFKLWSFSNNSSYSEGLTISAKTLLTEPSNHILELEANSIGTDSISLIWNDNQGTHPAEGYMICIAENGFDIQDPTDSEDVEDDIDISDGLGNIKINQGNELYVWKNLKESTNYQIKVFPYANAGSDVNYKTESAPSLNIRTKIQPEAPVLIPSSLEFTDSTFVKMTCVTDSVVMFYTIDDSMPNNEAEIYTDSIKISATTTIKAISILNGISSTFTQATYTKIETPQIPPPYFYPEGDEFNDSVEVTILCELTDAQIFYTTNGDKPTRESQQYNAPIIIKETTTIKAISLINNNESDVVENNYTISHTPHPVEISSIIELRDSKYDETTYLFKGEGVVTFSIDSNQQIYIQDSTGAILVNNDNNIITDQYEIDEGITNLKGKLFDHQGLLQFIPESEGEKVETPTHNPVPVEVTITELINNFELYESRLIKIINVLFSETGVFETGTNYTIKQNETQGVLRTQFYNANYIDTPIPESNQNITGIALWNNSEAIITPRSLSDIEHKNQTGKLQNEIIISRTQNKLYIVKNNNKRGLLTITNILGQTLSRNEINQSRYSTDVKFDGLIVVTYSEKGNILFSKKILMR